MSLAGGCLCGQVRYEARGQPLNVRCCHCTLCQKAGGAPFFARAMFALGDVTLTGETLDHPTSDRVMRRSCARCGALVFSQPNDPPARIAITVRADTTVMLGARLLLNEPGGDHSRKDYWRPEVWRESSEPCR